MAGGTGTGATTICFNPRNIIVTGTFHHSEAIGYFHNMLSAIVLDIGNLCHLLLFPFSVLS